jgi:hypoxanthine phosphoribosyltransferase
VYDDAIADVLISEKEIQAKIEEMAAQISADYEGREIRMVGVLKGAFMVISDLARALQTPLSIDFMSVASYGSGTSTSGVVRILKDLDGDIAGQHVLVVEDVIDSGLTLNWLLRNLRSRQPASIEVAALLRKPTAALVEVPVKYVGFDLDNVFVVGYGLDYAERYRNLPFIGTLKPEYVKTK